MKDSVKCRCCNGSGRIPLTGVYAETLFKVRRFCAKPSQFVMAGRDWKWIGSPTAMALNNRLAYLEREGFLRSERFGRQRRFYLP